jgi:hypothetical protein
VAVVELLHESDELEIERVPSYLFDPVVILLGLQGITMDRISARMQRWGDRRSGYGTKSGL